MSIVFVTSMKRLVLSVLVFLFNLPLYIYTNHIIRFRYVFSNRETEEIVANFVSVCLDVSSFLSVVFFSRQSVESLKPAAICLC